MRKPRDLSPPDPELGKQRALVAEAMVRRGYAPLVYAPLQNRPVGLAWQNSDPMHNANVLRDWPRLNIGWRMGVQPNGKRLLGLDDDGDLEAVELLLGPLPATWTQRTPSGGAHVVFRVPPGIPFRNTAKILVGGKRYELDVKCDNGALCLAPSQRRDPLCMAPELRKDGLYEVTNPGPIAALPERWVTALRYVEPPAPPPMRDDLMPSLERALRYTEKCEPAISGSGGSRATFRVACKAVEFGLDAGGVMKVLEAYNQRCMPPWSKKELQHKVQQALTRSQARPGAKL
jgi:hypothetical protein